MKYDIKLPVEVEAPSACCVRHSLVTARGIKPPASRHENKHQGKYTTQRIPFQVNHFIDLQE